LTLNEAKQEQKINSREDVPFFTLLWQQTPPNRLCNVVPRVGPFGTTMVPRQPPKRTNIAVYTFSNIWL